MDRLSWLLRFEMVNLEYELIPNIEGSQVAHFKHAYLNENSFAWETDENIPSRIAIKTFYSTSMIHQWLKTPINIIFRFKLLGIY